MSGYAYVRADARTVQDLRQLLRFLDDNLVSDEADVDWSAGYVYITAAEGASAEFIECGDHIPPDYKFDVILNTHDHPNYREPAMFDWPTKDRLKNETE